MQPNTITSRQLQDILGLDREPAAIKFFIDAEALGVLDLSHYDNNKRSRYCQAVMRASRGEKVILGADNIACASAAAAFGFKTLHPKLASGEAHYNVGTLGSQEAARCLMEDMPRLVFGDYAYVAVAPLAAAEFTPDVVLVEAPPENLMWIALASIYKTGERMHFSTSVSQAACVDCTVVPFTGGKINFTLGCNGCREATDLKITENMMGIPYHMLPDIVENLQAMQEGIVKNRGKSIYERFIK
jgi:uncharacterized protein (DUF169 family)